jgi:hypothetical protein
VSVRLYDLLGIDPTAAGQDTLAAALWPNDVVNATEGINLADDSVRIVRMLQASLSFDHVRPGADKDIQLGNPASPGGGAPGQISLAASMHIDSSGPPLPVLYLRKLPNIGLQLLPTGTDKAASVYFASDGRGHELLIEGLPVELQLPGGLINPDKDNVAQDGNPSDFSANDEDSLAVVKQLDPEPTYFRTHVRLHLTPAGDVILEPNVPLSTDGAKLSGFPVEAIHDIVLIPSPNRRDYFEWARNDLGSFIDNPPAPGAFAFRSISLDLGKPPFKGLAERFRDRSGVHSENVDVVLEDIVIPVTGLGFPIPSHGTFGLRRKITDRNSIAQAFSLDHAPFRLRLYTREGDANANEGLYLFIDQLLFKSGSTTSDTDEAPVLELNAGIVWQGDHGQTAGGTLGIGDDWLLQAGVTLGDQSPFKLTIASAVISLHALRGGIRLRQIGDGKDCWQVLGDLSIKDADQHQGDPSHSAFRITTLTGKPLDLILRDVGWSFGHVQLGKSIAAPEGVQLIFGGVVRLIVEEMGWVEEPGGGTYFSFSGGVAIGFGGGDDRRPNSNRDQQGGNAVGIRFRRLRFLTSDTPDAPPFKLDGIFLELHYGPVGISGFGYVSDEIDAGFRYQEFGFGAKVEFPALAVTLSLAAEFLKGTRRPIAGPNGGFSYFLASLQVGYIPAGPVGLYAVRVLVAYNMQPNVDPPGDGGDSMALYQWHKDHDAAIDMPRSRNLADWKPLDQSFAGGVGFGFSLNACGGLFHIGAFLLLAHSEEDTMILVVGDVYLLKNPEPIAFAAVEYDFKKEKFGIMAGVDLTIDKFVGGGHVVPHWLSNIARLSGTIYFGNEPWSLAIGHLADQRSWLGIRIDVPLLEIKLVLAVGLELTDGGPKGFGIVFAFSGGSNWGIGGFIVFGSFGFIIGTWKTGSDSSGIHAWAQIGFKIHVFYIFHFGADIGADITYLGKHPWYTTLAAQIHIDTPWFLPDVTFRFEKTWGESLPFDTSTITQSLSSGSAASPTAPGNDSRAALHVPPLADGNHDPARLYTFNELNATSGAALEDVHARDDMPIVAVDADISVEFTNSVANDAAIATDTFTTSGGDPGVQQVQDMTIRYALKSISVKRSPRFGAGAGSWTDLVAAVDTELDLSSGGSVHATPALSFRWDADSRADGLLAPKRLLLNCRTPYSLTVGSPHNDDEAIDADPGFPCCHHDRRKFAMTRWHWLEFSGLGPGVRLPEQQRFSDNGEWWHWTQRPATVNGSGPNASSHVVAFAEVRDGIIGSVDFSAPVYEAIVNIDTTLLHGSCLVEGYRGLDLLAVERINAGSPSQQVTLRAKIDAGFTRIIVRCRPGRAAHQTVVALSALNLAAWPKPNGLQVVAIGYLLCADAKVVVGGLGRCRSGDDLAPAVGGGGKLAFLPNHDYAVTATVEVTVSHKTGGSKTLSLSQPAYFRTKGLLGLNAVPNVGDELRPYIGSAYPPVESVLLYREEPVALAFTEDMSNLLPVDRVPALGDPPEKAQLLELTLSIERLASTEGAQRLTVPSNDWIDAHDGVIVVIGSLPPLLSGGFVSVVVRRAPSTDKRVLRFERVLDAGQCQHDPLHSSQVLVHEPVGPDGTPGLWEPQTGFRATVRGKDGPYTKRSSFQLVDMAAFDFLSDIGHTRRWLFDNGTIVGRTGWREYATFGDPTWNHFQITTRIDPAGSIAGVAIGVSGSTPVQQALLALIDQNNLIIVRRTAGADHEVARSPLPGVPGPLELHVTAFDDRLRAQIGDVTVEADRGPIREGRAALVADGPARFDNLLVDSLDMYQVGFHTSRYRSFSEHISMHDDHIADHQPDAMGGPPAATAVEVLSASGPAIAEAMTINADPQARQQLFAKLLSDLGLPQLERCDRLTFTRLIDATATTALLLESPEPISFLHDVTLTLLHRTRHYQPWWNDLIDPNPAISNALGRLRFERGAAFGAPDVIATLGQDGHEIAYVHDQGIDVYRQADDARERTVAATLHTTLDREAAQRAGLGDIIDQPTGSIFAIKPDRSIAAAATAPWRHGSWVDQDDPVACAFLTNGDETAALLIPNTSLVSGTYILDFTMDRARWLTTTVDPQSRYQQQASVEITW